MEQHHAQGREYYQPQQQPQTASPASAQAEHIQHQHQEYNGAAPGQPSSLEQPPTLVDSNSVSHSGGRSSNNVSGGFVPWTPTTASSTVDGLEHPQDENLPEVVPGQSPEALAHRGGVHHGLGENDPKYPVVYDNAPKLPQNPEMAHLEHYQNTMGAVGASPVDSIPWEPLSAAPGGGGVSERAVSEKREEEGTICGLKRRLFWLALVALIIVVAAAVGGGVGGGIAAARSRDGGSDTNTSASADAQTTAPPTSTSSTGSSSTKTSSASTPSVSFLNNQTDVPSGTQFQAFEKANYGKSGGNKTGIITREGFYDIGFHANSYVWLHETWGWCVTFCQGKEYSSNTSGWRCDNTYQPQSSRWFSRVYLWTGGPDANPTKNTTCS